MKGSTRARKGSILVMVLLLGVCLFILCAGFLSTKANEAMVGHLAADGFQARELAFSGLEAARVKLLNDKNFPPASMGEFHEVFSLTETVKSIDESEEIGRYQIHCDRRWVSPPYNLLRVTTIGQVGDLDGNPIRYKLVGEFAMEPGRRGFLINFIDMGTF